MACRAAVVAHHAAIGDSSTSPEDGAKAKRYVAADISELLVVELLDPSSSSSPHQHRLAITTVSTAFKSPNSAAETSRKAASAASGLPSTSRPDGGSVERPRTGDDGKSSTLCEFQVGFLRSVSPGGIETASPMTGIDPPLMTERAGYARTARRWTGCGQQCCCCCCCCSDAGGCSANERLADTSFVRAIAKSLPALVCVLAITAIIEGVIGILLLKLNVQGHFIAFKWSSGLQHGGPNVTDAGGRPSNVMLGYMFIAHFVMQSVLLVMCIVYGIVFYRKNRIPEYLWPAKLLVVIIAVFFVVFDTYCIYWSHGKLHTDYEVYGNFCTAAIVSAVLTIVQLIACVMLLVATVNKFNLELQHTYRPFIDQQIQADTLPLPPPPPHFPHQCQQQQQSEDKWTVDDSASAMSPGRNERTTQHEDRSPSKIDDQGKCSAAPPRLELRDDDADVGGESSVLEFRSATDRLMK